MIFEFPITSRKVNLVLMKIYFEVVWVSNLYNGEKLRTSCILLRWWWWCPLCTRPTCLVGFLEWVLIETPVCCRHIAPLGHNYTDSDPTSLLLLLNAACFVEKQQMPILLSWLIRPGIEPAIYHIQGYKV
jgi:hypothetical protein